MAPINISLQDRIYLERIVATEADHRLAQRDPDMYQRQVAGIVDTVLNRVASPQFPDTIAGVANQDRQFSAINGPRDRGYEVWGSVERVPDGIVPDVARSAVNDWVNSRIGGAPSSVGGNLHYANPLYSDAKNRQWIDALDGPRYGSGQSIHYHGTTDGYTPVEAQLAGDFYTADGVKLPPGEVPNIVATEMDVAPPARIEPTMPTPRDQRPPQQVSMPTPASERPEAPTEQAPARSLPTIGPTGIIAQDDVGTMPEMADVIGLGFSRQPTLRPEEVAATRPNAHTPQLDADGNVRYRHIPDEDLVRTSVTRGLGSLTPDAAIETAPDPIPATAMRQPQRPVPSDGGFAGQERGPVARRPGVQRTAEPVAGQVPMPRNVTPEAATTLTRQAETAQRRATLERQPQSFAGRETGPAKIMAPRPVSRAAPPQSFAGQERGPTSPPAREPAPSRPDPAPSPSRTQLAMAQQSYAGQERASPAAPPPATAAGVGARPRPEQIAPTAPPPNIGTRPRTGAAPTPAAPGAAAATSPAEVPKYITRTETIEIPQTYAGQEGGKPAANKRDAIPLGEMTYSVSRDNKGQRAAGAKTAETMGPTLRTRTVVELNPEWLRTQPAPKPTPERSDHGLAGDIRTAIGLPEEGIGEGLLGGIRGALGIPEEGFGPGIVEGLRNMIGLGGGTGLSGSASLRKPLDQASIRAANASPSNHNAHALAAINRGERWYQNSSGHRMPTTAMNGKVRHTYGDEDGPPRSLSG